MRGKVEATDIRRQVQEEIDRMTQANAAVMLVSRQVGT